MGSLRLFFAEAAAPAALAGLWWVRLFYLREPTRCCRRLAPSTRPSRPTPLRAPWADHNDYLESEAFDPVLSLRGPDDAEIAFNDDFGGTLNSKITIELPEDGVYSVVARSFSGQGATLTWSCAPRPSLK
jgi:hypothetical protein